MKRLRRWLSIQQLEDRTVPASIQRLGTFPGWSLQSPTGISADGNTVVGLGSSYQSYQAWKWTADDGILGLGGLPGSPLYSGANGISGDGSTVVGFSNVVYGAEGFRYSDANGVVGLGFLNGGGGVGPANAVSGDGSVIVGYAPGTGGYQAYRWTNADGMVPLGDLSGGIFNSQAYGVSNDGTTVIGYGNSASGQEAMRWTSAEGMVGLGDIPGGPFNSQANAISGDGTVIVGYSYSDSGYQAFRWTQPEGMVGLSDLAGGIFGSEAKAVSADGSAIFGFAHSSTGKKAFRWTAADGMRSLKEILETDYGLEMSGWNLLSVNACSANGLVIVGDGVFSGGNVGPYIVRLEPPPFGGTISGVVYVDANRNGQRDVGEVGQEGVVVVGQTSKGQITTTTLADGSYLLETTTNGTLQIEIMLPAGFKEVSQSPLSVSVSGGNTASVDIGIRRYERIAFATGAGPGGEPSVVVYDSDGTAPFGIYPYSKNFTGGVRVATADVDGDAIADIITGPGPGGGPHVRVFSGADGHLLAEFFAFAPAMTAGVFVAGGDVNGDGRVDIVVGSGAGAESRVRVFSGINLNGPPIRDFVAYPGFVVGVNVAVGDFNNDKRADIVTGPEAGNPHVKVFDGANPNGPLLRQFFAYDPKFPVGATVAVGNIDGDLVPDIVTGAGSPGGPHVRAFSGFNGLMLRDFFAFAGGFTGGVRVGAYDSFSFGGLFNILAAPGPTNLNPPGNSNSIRVFDPIGFASLELRPFGGFLGGAYVG
jgi:probable HAF family extracellular repeat protein